MRRLCGKSAVAAASVVAALTASACVPGVPHRAGTRAYQAAQSVVLTNVPAHGRVTFLDGGRRKMMVSDAEGQVTFTVLYEVHEHFDNGATSDRHANDTSETVLVQAPGYLPRKLSFKVPRTGSIDASLTRPAFYTLERTAPLDELLRASAEGRCEDAERAAERVFTGRGAEGALLAVREACAARADARYSDGLGRDWDPTAFAVPEEVAASPSAALGLLEAKAKTDSDTTTLEALRVIRALVGRARYEDATRVAALLADSLPPDRSALVLNLPASLAAVEYVRRVGALLRKHETMAAMASARAAFAEAPWVAADAYREAREARVQQLAKTARKLEEKAPAAARGYWLAAEATQADGADIAQGLARTEGAALETVRTRVAVVSNDAELQRALITRLAALVDAHVLVTDEIKDADGALILDAAAVHTSVETSVTHRTVSVAAYKVRQENAEYEPARQEVDLAEENMVSANESYNQLHASSQNMAAQASAGGAAGLIAGAGATGEEAAGVAILVAAKSRLSDAKHKLATTPPTVEETVMRDAPYPVIHYEAESSQGLQTKLVGFGEPLEDSKSASVHLSADQVLAAPRLGIAETPSPREAIAALRPDTKQVLEAIAQRTAKAIMESDEQAAWASVLIAQQERPARPAAEAAAVAMYLAVAPKSAHRDDLVRRLAEVLP